MPDYSREIAKQSELQVMQDAEIDAIDLQSPLKESTPATSRLQTLGAAVLNLVGGAPNRSSTPECEVVRCRTKAAALLGAAAFVLTGCTPTSRQPSLPQRTTIAIDPHEIASEYPYLPPLIKQATLAVNKESVLATGTFYGSGVFVRYDGKVRALTAAHLLDGANCVNSLIHANTSFLHSDYFVERQGEITPPPYFDAGVQNLVNDSSLQNIALPASAIPDKPLSDLRGSIGFSVSFEPTGTGIGRTPNSPDSYSAPAEFSEVILGEEGGDYFAVDGIGASYGYKWDNTGRPGESGSPVFTSDGHIIGLSIKGTTWSASNILAEFGVQLPDTGRPYHLSIIQPIDSDIMHGLDAAADAAPLCN